MLKLVAMLLVLSAIREPPLLTIGDEVKSFLDTPDKTTPGLGVVGRAHFINCVPRKWAPGEGVYHAKRKRWYVAVGRFWIACAVFL